MRPMAKEWLASANGDLQTIHAIMGREDLTNVVAFHSQQCIEKCFKAILEEQQIVMPKIHNLVTLYHAIKKWLPISVDLDILDLLNKLYTDSRYPSDMGWLPSGKPTLEDAHIFLSIAQNIYSYLDKLGPAK
ncbi:MAG: HEPN domain-containing protein [Pseudomonadota bacterium]